MREIRTSGSEGGGIEPGRFSLPYHMWTAPSRKDIATATVWSNAIICPALWCGHMTAAQMGYADRVPNTLVMSKHQWTPRVVPILGSTDHHLAVAVLSSARWWYLCGSEQ
jgi:hypothetical protein